MTWKVCPPEDGVLGSAGVGIFWRRVRVPVAGRDDLEILVSHLVRVLLRPLHVLERGPGHADPDLHDLGLSVACAFRKERDGFPARKDVESFFEEDAVVLALALSWDVPQAHRDALEGGVCEQRGRRPVAEDPPMR